METLLVTIGITGVATLIAALDEWARSLGLPEIWI